MEIIYYSELIYKSFNNAYNKILSSDLSNFDKLNSIIILLNYNDNSIKSNIYYLKKHNINLFINTNKTINLLDNVRLIIANIIYCSSYNIGHLLLKNANYLTINYIANTLYTDLYGQIYNIIKYRKIIKYLYMRKNMYYYFQKYTVDNYKKEYFIDFNYYSRKYINIIYF